jgi:hypothetical protein
MNLGSSLQLFALEVDLLQGLVNFLHEALPSFRTIEDPDGSFRLELDPPQIEIRDNDDFRMGIHLTGRLFLGTDPNALFFDAWVRLRPEVGADQDGNPVGALVFDAVEEVTPALAETTVSEAFGPDGPVAAALDALKLDVFSALMASIHDQIFPGTALDRSAFAVAFYLGRPAAMPRPVWQIRRDGDHYVPDLDLDISHVTTPALVASVTLAGQEPVPPGSPSIVRPGTGLALVTTARLFEARFALESVAIVGTELQGLTMDSFEASSTAYGFDIVGEGHKTGASVSFSGALIAQFRGGVGGQLIMRSTVVTDVDTAWWVDLLSVVAALVPGIGWFLGDVFIWGPEAEAPGKVEAALLDKFHTPLSEAAQRVANEFSIDIIPTTAFLADVWFFEGNMAVAAAAFVGRRTEGVRAVSRDVAHVTRDPSGAGRHTNRRRPVESVEEIVLTSGHALKPWQAGKLVADRLLTIPGHHAVHNPLARGGVYLRSNPDDDSSNNLL